MSRPPLPRLRRALAPAVILLAVAAMCGVLYAAERTSRREWNGVNATAAAPSPSKPPAARSKVTSAFVDASRPVRQRHVVDALLVSAALAFAAATYRRHADTRLRDQLRIDSVFARRRGPPALQLTR